MENSLSEEELETLLHRAIRDHVPEEYGDDAIEHDDVSLRQASQSINIFDITGGPRPFEDFDESRWYYSDVDDYTVEFAIDGEVGDGHYQVRMTYR